MISVCYALKIIKITKKSQCIHAKYNDDLFLLALVINISTFHRIQIISTDFEVSQISNY